MTYQEWCSDLLIDVDYLEVCVKQSDFDAAFAHLKTIGPIYDDHPLAKSIINPNDLTATFAGLLRDLELAYDEYVDEYCS